MVNNKALMITYIFTVAILSGIGWVYILTHFQGAINSISFETWLVSYLYFFGFLFFVTFIFYFLPFIVFSDKKDTKLKFRIFFIILLLSVIFPFVFVGLLGISEIVFKDLLSMSFLLIVLGFIIYFSKLKADLRKV